MFLETLCDVFFYYLQIKHLNDHVHMKQRNILHQSNADPSGPEHVVPVVSGTGTLATDHFRLQGGTSLGCCYAVLSMSSTEWKTSDFSDPVIAFGSFCLF
ncbi:hypothetical protein ILYODFUR_016196 [Ilyodon furcidens]|uniref:Uncharacterized protein n=1 Tax=Ilyodon furcidens TaxID=33524 RepID=A0ABV0U8U9_9TELE